MTSASLPLSHADSPRLLADQRSRVALAGGGLAVLGVVLGIAAAVADAQRFAFSYLVGFEAVLTVGLGGLFLTVIQHLVRAGWSVGPRRQLEWLAGVLPICALLFVPVVLLAKYLYAPWMDPKLAAEPMVHAKLGYLNPTFFYIRAAFYFAVWSGLSWFFRSNSAKQDVSGDATITTRLQAASAPATLVFGLTLTFAAFDWLMSLQPRWYSTIFGVYIFAGSTVSALAVTALLTIALQRSGLIQRVSTVEHRHDLGKLMFGFTVFWAYIAFSQYFLIWYANIPEETIFFRLREVGTWGTVGRALVMLQFALPFVLLLPRTTKRSFFGLALGAVVILIGHYVDLYWLVMPNLDAPGMHFSWIDVAGLLGPVGVLCGWLALRASRDNLYPLLDPRLHEAMKLDNP